MAQHRKRGVTLATRDRGRHHAIDQTARAHQKNGGSAPCNWRGSGRKNVFKNSHSAIFQVAGATSCSCQCCGNSLNLPDADFKDFQRAVIYRPDWLEIGSAGGLTPQGPHRRVAMSLRILKAGILDLSIAQPRIARAAQMGQA